MPNFRLSQDEAERLARFLERQAKGTINADVATAKGNPERGQKLFSAMRCDHCHQLTTTSKLILPNVRSVWNAKTASGCLRPAGETSRTAPGYTWTDAEREALNSYLTEKPEGVVSVGAGNRPELERMLATLRCTACHARDGSNARWPEIVAEEGSGKLPESAPQLTWVGEKLQGPWIAQLLRGKLEHKPRPWITARMPSFPAYAEIVAHAMAAEHGVPFHEPLVMEADPRLIETGEKLTQRDGGLDCRQCHALGNEKPRGDAATQIALGINFAFTRDRLRTEFALRQMLDPPRYDIGSRMPRFAPDLQTTAAKQIEGGNAKKQFEAIKQYLWSLKTEKTQD
jgi:cytochrome c2